MAIKKIDLSGRPAQTRLCGDYMYVGL